MRREDEPASDATMQWVRELAEELGLVPTVVTERGWVLVKSDGGADRPSVDALETCREAVESF
jgi:hypothetical protein